MASQGISFSVDQRQLRELNTAMESLLKKDRAALLKVGAEIVEQIADDAASGSSGIGGGSIADSYSFNFTGSGSARGKVRGRAKKKYGVAVPKRSKSKPIFVAGSGHPLAHIFELGTESRRTTGRGKTASGRDRVQFKPASRGRISKDRTLTTAYQRNIGTAMDKIKHSLACVRV